MSSELSIYDTPAIDRLRHELRFDPHALRRYRNALLKHGRADADAATELPADVREEFLRRVGLHPLELHCRNDSQQDGASKLLFRTRAGMLIESVILRIATGRTTLCVSSQVGCAAACDFCATGKMGIAQNLQPAEILDQITQSRQILATEGRQLRNLVFMGMGEPFHNEENLYATLEALQAPELFHQPPSRILVSTVGLPNAMIRCARRFPNLNLALSLHSANQETRQQIIPLAKRFPLAELRRALVELNRIQPKSTEVMVEYLMLGGVNDSLESAAELAAWLDGLRVHVNLIPFNPIDDAPHLQGADRPTREAFGAHLKSAGLKTTIRYSLGADVAAACGQLVRKENRKHAIAIKTANLSEA
ncbi:23S rRNA (adenine(2503)-C(2))-methyltransferase RlmN [Lacipirellula parvula]|uniref:Methyltransferase n=1 Tax=Lacipirellula parvula TaxID=2650471 RepID=A0A5K7XLE5_9BACT|nr:23S rRNA (adenine(2503)-C(2))-methyltransferase RlmN [Lacipirellula parvula]BBO36131.1 methyltransferase [Lacipirellula parvula]